jgi:predicted nucleic acid-binding protein
MERAPDGRILVVSDTNVLINFLRVGRLDLLSQHKDYRFVVTEHAQAEITDAAQRAELEAAIAAKSIGETSLTDPPEIAVFATLNAFLGRGESGAIAVAATRNWVVATDETRRAKREIESRMGQGRQLTTPGVLLRCILNGTLTVADADAIKVQLAAQRFVMKFTSFADLLPKPPTP